TAADELVAEAFETIELRRVAPALAVDLAVVDVDTRRGDRLLDRHSVMGDVAHDPHDRAPQPDRSGAADDEAGALVVEGQRRRHHARQTGARPGSAAWRVEVVLAEHVVHVDAGAGDDDA